MSVALLKISWLTSHINSRLETDLLQAQYDYVWQLAMTYQIFFDNAVMKVL